MTYTLGGTMRVRSPSRAVRARLEWAPARRWTLTTKTTYTVTVTATDPYSQTHDTITVTIRVTNVDEAPTIDDAETQNAGNDLMAKDHPEDA